MQHSDLTGKLRLRLDAIDGLGGPVAVLDAFAGGGDLWRTIRRRRPEKVAAVVGIETDPTNTRPGAGVIIGDNLDVMPQLDLDRFNVVDLDAWGWPDQQLALVPAAVSTVVLTRPGPGASRPARVRDAGGWRPYVEGLGWEITARSRAGAMIYETLHRPPDKETP